MDSRHGSIATATICSGNSRRRSAVVAIGHAAYPLPALPVDGDGHVAAGHGRGGYGARNWGLSVTPSDLGCVGDRAAVLLARLNRKRKGVRCRGTIRSHPVCRLNEACLIACRWCCRELSDLGNA